MFYYPSDIQSLADFEGERLTKAEERAKSNSKRLDRLERLADEVGKQNENIARLVVQLEYSNKQLGLLEARLRELEKTPRRRLDTVIGAIITALCSAFVGGFVTTLF